MAMRTKMYEPNWTQTMLKWFSFADNVLGDPSYGGDVWTATPGGAGHLDFPNKPKERQPRHR